MGALPIFAPLNHSHAYPCAPGFRKETLKAFGNPLLLMATGRTGHSRRAHRGGQLLARKGRACRA